MQCPHCQKSIQVVADAGQTDVADETQMSSRRRRRLNGEAERRRSSRGESEKRHRSERSGRDRNIDREERRQRPQKTGTNPLTTVLMLGAMGGVSLVIVVGATWGVVALFEYGESGQSSDPAVADAGEPDGGLEAQSSASNMPGTTDSGRQDTGLFDRASQDLSGPGNFPSRQEPPPVSVAQRSSVLLSVRQAPEPGCGLLLSPPLGQRAVRRVEPGP